MARGPDEPLLRLTSGVRETRAALAEALAGGPPVAPLPSDPVERRRAVAMLRPELPVSEPDAAAVVATSGSSGEPKGVVLSRTAIRTAVAATHERLGGPRPWTLALPVHYVAGLMVLARSVLAGTELRGLDQPPEGYLALVPTQLLRMLGTESDRLRDHRAILLGGAAADPPLLERAAACGVQVVTTYGMSETCGGCVYDGRALSGVEVVLDDGRISLGGPVLFSGYRLRPDLTAAVLENGRFRTSDRGHLEDDRLVVDGRVDDVVVSGGLNVDLAAVERVARARTGTELVVLALPDPEWGSLVVAVTEGSGDLPALRAALADDLPAHAHPRRVVRKNPMPRTSSGKIDRQRLLRELATDPSTSSPGRQESS